MQKKKKEKHVKFCILVATLLNNSINSYISRTIYKNKHMKTSWRQPII